MTPLAAACRFLWATGRLPYITDDDSFSARGLVRFALTAAAIPAWRELHFYFAHRCAHHMYCRCCCCCSLLLVRLLLMLLQCLPPPLLLLLLLLLLLI
jgi:hypothetical protein